jgi:hypothetical protein
MTLIAIEPSRYDNFIILSQGQMDDDDETTESETILILMLLRGILENAPENGKRTKFITEVLNAEDSLVVIAENET